MSSQLNVNHFSHPHPLTLSNSETTVICSCCTLKASGWIRSCEACNYFLHVECSELPKEAPHPCDRTHPLCLLAKPPTHSCTACYKLFKGFSYVCEECDIHLHIACARMPLTIGHRSHNHTLSLTFSSPKKSNCKICSNVIGDKQWWYRCSMCNFDAHVACANSRQTVGNSSSSATSQTVGNSSTSQDINMGKRGVVTSIAPLIASTAAVGLTSVMVQGAARSAYNHWQTASTNAHATSQGDGGALSQEGTVAVTDDGGFWDTIGDVVSGLFF